MSGSRRLPNAFLLGAAKAGTTSLAAAIGDLDRSFVPTVKETHFFDDDDAYTHGRHWYEAFFSDAGDATWVWDCTPNYFHRPEVVIPRLRETYDPAELASVRFVVVLRDPVQRAYSHYLHQQRVAAEDRSFKDAVASDKVADDWSNYRQDSEYGRQLKLWFDAFGPARFLVVIAEDYTSYDDIATLIAQEFGLGESVSVPTLNAHREARSGRLMEFLARPPAPVSALAQRFVPLRTRRMVRTRLRSLNLRPAPRPAPDQAAATALGSQLAEDRTLLASLLGRDLPW